MRRNWRCPRTARTRRAACAWLALAALPIAMLLPLLAGFPQARAQGTPDNQPAAPDNQPATPRPQGPIELAADFAGGTLAAKFEADGRTPRPHVLKAATYTISRELTITAQAVLQVRSGATLRFAAGIGATVAGSLTLTGTKDAPVTLSPKDGNGWAGVLVQGSGEFVATHAELASGRGRLASPQAHLGARRPPATANASSAGGCVLVDGGRAQLTDVRVQDGQVFGAGGGIYVARGVLLAERLTIRECKAAYGGGLALARARGATLRRLTLSGNKATQAGGGLFAYQHAGTFVLDTATLTRNVAGTTGGGAAIIGRTGPAVRGALSVTNNRAPVGAGLALTGVAGTALRNVRFADNVASHRGGGLLLSGTSAVTLRGCRFERNASAAGGGGVLAEFAGFSATRCLFSSNRAGAGHYGAAVLIVAADGQSAGLEAVRGKNQFRDNTPAADSVALER